MNRWFLVVVAKVSLSLERERDGEIKKRVKERFRWSMSRLFPWILDWKSLFARGEFRIGTKEPWSDERPKMEARLYTRCITIPFTIISRIAFSTKRVLHLNFSPCFFSSIPVRGRTRVARFQVAFETLLWTLLARRVLLGRRRYRWRCSLNTVEKCGRCFSSNCVYELEELVTIQFIFDRSFLFIKLCPKQIFEKSSLDSRIISTV